MVRNVTDIIKYAEQLNSTLVLSVQAGQVNSNENDESATTLSIPIVISNHCLLGEYCEIIEIPQGNLLSVFTVH